VAGDQDAALSSIGLTELVPRNLPRTDPEDAASPRILHRRNAPRCDGLSYTKETAMLAGKIDGEQQAKGVTVPFGDLLIGHGALAWLLCSDRQSPPLPARPRPANPPALACKIFF
jgi:predicted nucleic acid-binding protein